MTTTALHTPPRPPEVTTASGAGGDLAVGALALAALSATTCWLLGLPTSHLLETGGLYAALGLVVVRRLPAARPGPGIGPANRVTLARVALVLPVVTLALEVARRAGAGAPTLGERGLWWTLALATLAMALDGVDGRVARRTGSETSFGARFDMEVDALLLLALSGIAWGTGKAGAWVLLIGGLRYLFVLAGGPIPALRGALPPSLRRKTVCVVQGVSLLVGVAPPTPPPIAGGILAAALLVLGYSFAVDAVWLLRAPNGATATRFVRTRGHPTV